MACKNDSRSLFQCILNSGERSANTLIAGDLFATGGERNVEINANENSFALQIKIADRQLRHIFFHCRRHAILGFPDAAHRQLVAVSDRRLRINGGDFR